MEYLDNLIQYAVGQGASDIHFKPDTAVTLRVAGLLVTAQLAVPTKDQVAEIVRTILPPHLVDRLHSAREVDFSYLYDNRWRFRVNVFYQRGNLCLAMRYVKTKIPSFTELHLPDQLAKVATAENGIVFVTGTTGSGKSSTLAAMLGYINLHEQCHIITLEDPIEYVFDDDQSVIEQREIGLDTMSFTNALVHVLRQDPDVIMIGEMRDSASFMAALAAADTGHLVLTTLHTTTAGSAIGRTLDFFPAEERDQMRRQIAANLRAVVCQRLVTSIGGGVVPAVEIMINTPMVRKLIEENRLDKLSAAIETGTEDGMQSFNQSLLKLVKTKMITEGEALAKATNPDALKMNFRGIFLDESRRIISTDELHGAGLLVYCRAVAVVHLMDDSIAAISTPIGEGGIAIIRISGPRALAIADAVFVSAAGLPSTYPSHTIHFGRILGADQQTLDEVLLTVMRRPRTYTAEDLIEINCHGGLHIARSILAQCLREGARLADPGEFTKRAFLNGRIDLTQAEAVMDVIAAKTERAHTVAEHALEGYLSRKVESIREQLLAILAHVEAQIDFPDEDLSPATRVESATGLTSVITGISELLATAKEGKILRNGISIAIFGRPNVGKSSLMNALLGEERSIVTAIPGTTRDTVEETANIRGIPIRFTDTAGIRMPRGKVEELGVNRSHNVLRLSDIGIHVLDSSKPVSPADIELAKRYDDKHVIKVLNKIDLPRKLILPKELQSFHIVEISAITGQGIEQLKDQIEHDILKGTSNNSRSGVGRFCEAAKPLKESPIATHDSGVSRTRLHRVGLQRVSDNAGTHSTSTISSDMEIAVNDRHADALRRTIKELESAQSDLKSNINIEIVAQQIRIGLTVIGEIVGKTTTEDLLDSIFSKFCIGK